jgi:excisionase family DNA binding protein
VAALEDRFRALPDCPSGRPPRLLLRVPEAAALCSIGRTLAYELVAAGTWPSIRINTAVRIPLDGLLTWLDRELKERQG